MRGEAFRQVRNGVAMDGIDKSGRAGKAEMGTVRRVEFWQARNVPARL